MLKQEIRDCLEETVENALTTFSDTLLPIREEAQLSSSDGMKAFAKLYDQANPDIAEKISSGKTDFSHNIDGYAR